MIGTEADRRVEALAAKQHGAFTVAQASAAGLSRGAVRHRIGSGRWELVIPGVYRQRGTEVTWQLRLHGAILSAGPAAAASHRAAAQLHGFPGYNGNWVEVTGPLGLHPRSRPARGYQSRKLPPHHVKQIDGIPVTSVARTLLDLAAVLHPAETERALDNCLVRKLVTAEAAWRVYQDVGGQGRSGSRVFRELLDARGEGYVAPASELERRFIRDVVIPFDLPTPRRERDIGDSDGWIGRVEFVYFEAKVLVEIDGRLFHTALVDRRRDRDRDNRFMAAGWRVIRIDYEMLTKTPELVARLIRKALLAAA